MPQYVYFPLHPLWNECITAYLAHLYSMSQSPHTVRGYRAVLKAFFADCRKSPADYLRADVEAYLASPTAGRRTHHTQPSASTRYNRLTVLSSFYTFASHWVILADGTRRYLYSEPSPTIGIAYGKRPHTHHALAASDLATLFAVIPHDTVVGARDRAILLCYLYTARRREEIARLRYGDIEQRTLSDASGNRYSATVFRFRGKGQGMAYEYAELPSPAKAAIDRYLSLSGRDRTITASDPLFVSHGNRKGDALTSGAMAYQLKKYLRVAGLSPDISLHSLRHSSARIRYEQGQDIRSIQQLLRHANIATTSRYLEELTGVADTGAHLLEKQFASL